jgi:hypothetical protein
MRLGVALGVVGVLLVSGAAQNSSSQATGLDGALRALREQPDGPWLLSAVALGIAGYGVARAKQHASDLYGPRTADATAARLLRR